MSLITQGKVLGQEQVSQCLSDTQFGFCSDHSAVALVYIDARLHRTRLILFA